MERSRKIQHLRINDGYVLYALMFMHILSKRFGDAGLRYVFIQSGVIGEGTVDRALCGKMYNRGVRIYKLMYEAIMRKAFDSI